MTPEQLEEHLKFVNRIWGTNASLDEYGSPNRGHYIVLIAGHSRVIALKSIKDDQQSPISVNCFIHEFSSSAGFLSLQLAENTHSSVSLERRAVAVVEMYNYGHDENAKPDDCSHWSSYADFIKKNPGNLSEDVLSDGMAFAELPPEVRSFIFAGELYYGAGVEIGKNAGIIKSYVRYRLQRTIEVDDQEKAQFNKAYKDELNIMIDHIINSRQDSKGGLKKALIYIKGEISHMKDVIDPKTQENSQQTMFDDIMNAPYIQREQYLKELEKEYKDIVRKTKQRPALVAIRRLELAGVLTGNDTTGDIREVRQAYMREIGKPAIDAALNSTL